MTGPTPRTWPEAARVAWGRAITLALDVTAEGCPATPAAPLIDRPLADLTRLGIACATQPFPIAGFTPSRAAEGFVKMVQAFSHARLPEYRAAYAPALRALATCLAELLRLDAETAQAANAAAIARVCGDTGE